MGNDHPIIGILAIETLRLKKYFPEYHSYIGSTYVKFLESAGAQVVPVWIGQEVEYYQRVIKYTNGILLPGGAIFFEKYEGYNDAVKIIYRFAMETFNTNGIYYPIFGICLGMEALIIAAVNGKDIRQCSFDTKNVCLPFHILENKNRMYAKLPKVKIIPPYRYNIKRPTRKTPTVKSIKYCKVFHRHSFVLVESDLAAHGLLEEWLITGESFNSCGGKFISSIEHKVYPFFAIQFHPEKIYGFQDVEISNILLSRQFSQYLANFFVCECKKNDQHFPSKILERKSLIHNFNPIFKALDTRLIQLYLFNYKHYRNQLDK